MPVDWQAMYGTATKWIGTPYVYGGDSPTGFDCSGFTSSAYASVGINIGRTTVDQLKSGQTVGTDGNWAADIQQLQPGDLVFYGAPGASGPNAHVVMYIGNGQVIQAGGSNVNITNLFSSAAADEPFLGVRRYTQFTNVPNQTFNLASMGASVSTTNPAGPSQGDQGGMLPTLNTAPPPADQVASLDQAIQQNFPTEAWMLGVPELKSLLELSTFNNWNENQLTAALQNTNWWKSTSAAVRQFQEQQAQDPSMFDFNVPGSKVNLTYQDIANQAAQLGVSLSVQQLQGLALNALKFGWSAAQIQGFIGTYVTAGQNAMGAGSNAGSVYAKLSSDANNYLYNPSQQVLDQWAQNLTGGIQNEAQWNSFLQQQAAVKYSWAAPQLSQGYTMQQIVDPLRQDAAQLMEVSPSSIDFVNNPTYSKILNYQPPGQTTGPWPAPRAMTTSEASTYLRGTPQYGYTQQARDNAAGLEQQILQTWGKVAG
jgi:hypothetical protein